MESLLDTEGISCTQIILVDDGSTDESGTIADSYAAEYEFISCYHKKNGGLSVARNFGLDKACGRYVFFLDPDDLVAPSSMRKVIEITAGSDVDVILWDGSAIDEKGNDISSDMDLILVHKGLPLNGEIISGTDSMVMQIEDHKKTAMTAWLRAVRRDYLTENKLYFEKGLLHEDELWTPQVMCGAEKVMYLTEKLYRYRIRKGSITDSSANNRLKHAQSYVHIMDCLYGYYVNNISDGKNLSILLADWADTYLWEIRDLKFGKYDIRKQIPKRKILSCAGSFRSKIKAFVLLISGAKLYCALFR